MIRGAIAFALVLKIPYACPTTPKDCFTLPDYEVAKSTTLIIVMVTTLLFGTFMKAFQTWLLGPPPKKRTETQIDVLSRFHSIYEEIRHPNEEESEDDAPDPQKQQLKTSIKMSMLRQSMAKSRAMSYLLPDGPEEGGFSDSRFAKWFVEFDEHKLRPFLIRNYSYEVVLL
jgi:hypothetical protein